MRAAGRTASKAAGRERLAAIGALLLFASVVVATLAMVADEPVRRAAEVFLIVVAVGSAWVALTTTRARRAFAEVVCLALKRSETEGTPVPVATRGVLF